MEFSANQIAQLLDGTVEGNGDIKVNNLSKIEEGVPKTLSFLANPKYAGYIYSTKASIVIVAHSFVPEKAIPSTCVLIRVKDPYSCFALLLEKYNQSKSKKVGISESAKIDSTASIGPDCYVGDFVSIGINTTIGENVRLYPGCIIGDNVTIGSNSIIFSNSVIYSDCVLGESCTIHSGVVIGSDGFGFAPSSDQEYNKVPQIGNVILENQVEIGANTCIDRATLGSTIIRNGVKLDNLIQIAHNVEIGEHTVIAGQTGIAGSTKIGSNCLIGGQVGIVGHISIANNVKIAAQSGIQNSIDVDGAVVQGSPAFAIGDYKRSYVLFRSLPRIKSKLDNIEKEIKNSK